MPLRRGGPCHVILDPTMDHFRRKPSSTRPTDRPPTLTSFIKKEVVRVHSIAKKPGVIAASSSSIALSICSSPREPSDVGSGDPECSKESGWRTAYGAARMAVEVTKESSDMFLPLKAVAGALAVLIKNYDVQCPQVFCPINR